MGQSATEQLLYGAQAKSQVGVSATEELLGVSKKAAAQPLGSLTLTPRETPAPATITTHAKAAFVDDPQTKLKIYATTRFPNDPSAVGRYGYHNGDVVFVGDDDHVYLEAGRGFLAGFKKGAGEMVGHSPSLVLGTVGAVAGPVSSAAGAMAGEGIRKGIGNIVFGEPQTAMGNVKAVGMEGLYDTAGYALGATVGKGTDWLLGKRGGTLAGAIGDKSKVDMKKAENIYDLAKRQFGIDLPAPASTESRSLIDKFNLLGDLPRTQDKIQGMRHILMEQTDDAVYRFLDTVAPSTTTPLRAGKAAQEAAKAALGREPTLKRALTEPLYRDAFKEAPDVDIAPVVDFINDKLKNAKGGIRDSLLHIKKTLLNPDLPKVTKTPELYDAYGRNISRQFSSYDTQLAGLHGAKLEIGRMIETAQDTSLGRTSKRNLTEIQNLLLEQMDSASPKYKLARKAYSMPIMSLEAEAAQSVLQDVAKLEGEHVRIAAKEILSSQYATPETVLRARLLIRRENPQAWDAIVRTYIQDSFESIKINMTDDAVNIGGHLHKQLFGNKRQRAIMQAAMPQQQFQGWSDLMEVMRRTGHLFRRESMTMPRQQAMKEMQQEAGSRISSLLKTDLTVPFKQIGQWIDDSLFGKYNDRLVTAMASPKAWGQLKRLKQLPPSSQKFMREFSVFMGMVVGNEFETRTDTRIILPEQLQP